jgi:hypothetical protein
MLSRPIALLILLAGITQMATAATDAELRKCQALNDDPTRLACYDAAMQSAPTTPASERPAAAPQSAAAAPQSSAAAPVSPVTATRQPPATKADMSTATVAPAPVPTAPATPVATQNTEPTPAVQTTEDFGLPKEPDWEQIKDNQMVATVSGVSKTPLGSTIVELDNGHVWQQVDDKRLTLRKGDEVNIREGMGGSFYLAKTSGSRSLKVRRTK